MINTTYLKQVVTDGMFLKGLGPNKDNDIIIRRYPNNVIMMHGKAVSWDLLLGLILNGEYELIVQEQDKDIVTEKIIPLPKRGRPQKDKHEKKTPLSISLNREDIVKLKGISSYLSKNRSASVAHLIECFFNQNVDEIKKTWG